MFIPTSFPCTAWYVTPALNVLETTVQQKARGWYDIFRCADDRMLFSTELFPTREAAIAGAVAKLAEDEARVARAIGRHARRRKMVAGLQKGGGV